MWREGEFRLDPVWKILIAQPGLSAEDVAPPLLVFKAYENELGVIVRMPQALSAIPRGEQVRLRDALGIQRADFAKAIDDMKALAAVGDGGAAASRSWRAPPRPARARTRRAGRRRRNKKVAGRRSRRARLLALGLGIGGLCRARVRPLVRAAQHRRRSSTWPTSPARCSWRTAAPSVRR